LNEECLVWGQNHVGDLLCLECLRPTSDKSVCEFCGYPLCNQHQKNCPTHQIECEVLRQCNFKLSPVIRDNEMETAYPLIAPLRCLRLKSTNPAAWRVVRNLMDHREERERLPSVYIEPYRHDVIHKMVNDLNIATEEEVVQVLGYLDVNSLAVRGMDGVYRGRGIYPVASLMNHSCVCNTRNIIENTRLETRATVDIKKGECITTHYVSPLLPLSTRREKLRERWFFSCECLRCKSNTDLGAFNSGVKCDECEGYFLPDDPLDFSTLYSCCDCGKKKSAEEMEHIVSKFTPLIQALQMFQIPGTTEEENLLESLKQSLHTNHYLVLELKLNLARKLGRTSGLLDSATSDTLLKKITLCCESLGVMNIIYPGASKYRGLLFYEMSESLLVLAGRLMEENETISNSITLQTLSNLNIDNLIRAQRDDIAEKDELAVNITGENSKDAFIRILSTCQLIIKEGKNCLHFDRGGSYEHEVYIKLHQMQSTCADFVTFQNFL